MKILHQNALFLHKITKQILVRNTASFPKKLIPTFSRPLLQNSGFATGPYHFLRIGVEKVESGERSMHACTKLPYVLSGLRSMRHDTITSNNTRRRAQTAAIEDKKFEQSSRNARKPIAVPVRR